MARGYRILFRVLTGQSGSAGYAEISSTDDAISTRTESGHLLTGVGESINARSVKPNLRTTWAPGADPNSCRKTTNKIRA